MQAGLRQGPHPNCAWSACRHASNPVNLGSNAQGDPHADTDGTVRQQQQVTAAKRDTQSAATLQASQEAGRFWSKGWARAGSHAPHLPDVDAAQHTAAAAADGCSSALALHADDSCLWILADSSRHYQTGARGVVCCETYAAARTRSASAYEGLSTLANPRAMLQEGEDCCAQGALNAREAHGMDHGKCPGAPRAAAKTSDARGHKHVGGSLAGQQCHCLAFCSKCLMMPEMRVRGGTLACGAASAKHFQKRSVSSAAAEQTVVPSGDCARCSTREVWPDISATLAMDGYFHRHSWFWLKPWLLRISRSCRLHCSAHTCRPGAHIRQITLLETLVQLPRDVPAQIPGPIPRASLWCHASDCLASGHAHKQSARATQLVPHRALAGPAGEAHLTEPHSCCAGAGMNQAGAAPGGAGAARAPGSWCRWS